MQNWTEFTKISKLDDGTVVSLSPMYQDGKLPMGSIVCEILQDPE